MWVFIAFVEIYDMYLSIKLSDILYEQELNPIGRFLMRLDGGDVALFMALKMSAILIVLTGIIMFFYTKRNIIAWIFLILAFLSRLILLLFLEWF